MTEFTTGTGVNCTDGPCGKLSRLIVEPESQAVTHLVVEPHRGPARLVPAGLVDSVAGTIKLRCTQAEFGALDAADEQEVLPADGGYEVPRPDPRAMAGRGLGLPLASLSPHARRVQTEDVVPLGEVEVNQGDPVLATDGEIGRVHGLVIDPGSRHVSHVLLEEGHLWGRKEVAIPISAVAGLRGIVRLNISKQQVQDLPPVDIDHPVTG